MVSMYPCTLIRTYIIIDRLHASDAQYTNIYYANINLEQALALDPRKCMHVTPRTTGTYELWQ
jgi:hypothetical protein